MIKINHIVLLLIILIATISIGCKDQTQVLVLKASEPLEMEARKIENFSTNWIKKLESLTYSYSISSEEKIIALVFKRDNQWFYKEYWVRSGGAITIEPDEGELAYVTLPANKTIAYSWLMITSGDSTEPETCSYNEWIHIPFDNRKEVEGMNYDRQVFDLTSAGKKLSLKFLYKDTNRNSNDVFECVIQSR